VAHCLGHILDKGTEDADFFLNPGGRFLRQINQSDDFTAATRSEAGKSAYPK